MNIDLVDEEVSRIFNSIQNFEKKEDIRKAITALPDSQKRKFLLDKLIKRKEEIHELEHYFRFQKMLPILIRVKRKFMNKLNLKKELLHGVRSKEEKEKDSENLLDHSPVKFKYTESYEMKKTNKTPKNTSLDKNQSNSSRKGTEQSNQTTKIAKLRRTSTLKFMKKVEIDPINNKRIKTGENKKELSQTDFQTKKRGREILSQRTNMNRKLLFKISSSGKD